MVTAMRTTHNTHYTMSGVLYSNFRYCFRAHIQIGLGQRFPVVVKYTKNPSYRFAFDVNA
jgi:phosphoribosylaminoimidazole carboxylase (NCAIR synthetase)